MSNYYFSGTWEVAQWLRTARSQVWVSSPTIICHSSSSWFHVLFWAPQAPGTPVCTDVHASNKKIHKVKMCISFNHYFSSVLKLFYERIVMSCVVNMWTGHLSLFICFFKRKQTILFLLYIPIQVPTPPLRLPVMIKLIWGIGTLAWSFFLPRFGYSTIF